MNWTDFQKAFAENFSLREELGASVAVWGPDGVLLSLAGGFQDREKTFPWSASTPVLVWSATKGPAVACVLHALWQSSLSIESRVSTFWPEFAQAGKADITVEMLLQHQAGLCALETSPAVQDRAAVVDALARQPPAWTPGTAHGYHPRTFGFLLDELVRRVADGESLASYWHRVFAEPLSLRFWIGVPQDVLPQVAPVFASRQPLPKGDPFLSAFMTPGSLTSRSFASPKGLHSVDSMNEPKARASAYPGFGGIGTAEALAKFYALLACGGSLQGKTIFPPKALEPLQRGGVSGPDRVLLLDTAFICGFMRDPITPEGIKRRRTFGASLRAFGHPGAGGSLAFADPQHGLGFAYVMNQMAPGVLPNARATSLVDALYALYVS
jgi:CubicO group peptidase (beta-lactamase class C family)